MDTNQQNVFASTQGLNFHHHLPSGTEYINNRPRDDLNTQAKTLSVSGFAL